jgi:hypothetical protein
MPTRRSATLKVTPQQAIDSNSQKFTQNILNLNVLACCPRNPTDADLEKATQEARLGLKALNLPNALQEMLVAQICVPFTYLGQKSKLSRRCLENPEERKFQKNRTLNKPLLLI